MVVAARSLLLPPSPTVQGSDDAMDLDLSLAAHQVPSQPEDIRPSDWELWGEESTIDLCELSIETKGIMRQNLTYS